MSAALKSRIDMIQSRMALHLPFVSAVAMSMHVLIEKCPSGSAETNGDWVKFDPDFAGSLSDPELMFLYSHETMHKALMHMWRRGSREPQLWNIACDHVVNLALKKMGNSMLQMPKVGCADDRFRDMSEEHVYDLLLQEQEKNGGGKGQGSYVGDLVEGGGRTQADAEIEIINIAEACRMAGMKDGLIDLVLGQAGKSKVCWEEVLRSFVSSNVRSGQSWRRPGRRSESAEVYLPTLRSKVLGSIVVFGDVSGSMLSILGKVVTEMQGIIDDASPEFTHVICGDTRVTSVKTFNRGERIEVKTQGGGGTDFRPLFNEVDRQGWTPDCAIFLTDTYGEFPAVQPGYPVLWGVIGAGRSDVRVPFGEVVHAE